MGVGLVALGTVDVAVLCIGPQLGRDGLAGAGARLNSGLPINF